MVEQISSSHYFMKHSTTVYIHSSWAMFINLGRASSLFPNVVSFTVNRRGLWSARRKGTMTIDDNPSCPAPGRVTRGPGARSAGPRGDIWGGWMAGRKGRTVLRVNGSVSVSPSRQLTKRGQKGGRGFMAGSAFGLNELGIIASEGSLANSFCYI